MRNINAIPRSVEIQTIGLDNPLKLCRPLGGMFVAQDVMGLDRKMLEPSLQRWQQRVP